MQQVSDLYKSIYEGTHTKESKIVINGTEYSNAYIEAMSTQNALFQQFSIGNVVSRQIDIRLRGLATSLVPRMAELKPYVRIYNETQVSEWLPKSVFYVDSRSYDPDSDILTLQGFDAMLKANVIFMKSGTWSSQTAKTVVQTIASHMGVQIETATLTKLTNTTYYIDSIPIIGDDGTTENEMLSYIGAMYGGNWIIDDFGKLKIVGLVDIPTETYYLITEYGNPITFGGTRILVQ